MIPVQEQPEPPGFDSKVRQKGLKFLKGSGIVLNKPLPRRTNLKPYWRDCMGELYQSYGGVCAYLGLHFEEVLAAGSVDHFVAQSSRASLRLRMDQF